MNLNSLLFVFFLTACSVSYSFQGGKLNYKVIKTISIHDLCDKSIQAYPLLPQIFEQSLKRKYLEQTKLIQILNNGDIEIEGDIIQYDVRGVAINENVFASQIRLTIGVRIKCINRVSNNNIDQIFYASRECLFDQFEKKQEFLVCEIVGELVDMIYNKTVCDW